MKILIIYKSCHKRNTEKIAKAMSEEVNADLKKIEEVKIDDILKYDIIGFGSGIYAAKMHRKIYKFIKKIPSSKMKVFIFCTSGSGKYEEKHEVRDRLLEKGYNVIGEFSCPGEFSPFGFNVDKKGHPDEKDIKEACEFIKNICGENRK